MSTRFVPPSDAEIDDLSERLHYYEVVRYVAWRSYHQAQEDMMMTIQQDMRDAGLWLPANALPLPYEKTNQ